MGFPSDEVFYKGLTLAGLAWVLQIAMFVGSPISVMIGHRFLTKNEKEKKNWHKPVGIILIVFGVAIGLCAALSGPIRFMIWIAA